MPGIGIISNPHAGINRRDPEHNTLVWYVLGNRGQFEVTQSPKDLLPVCKEFFERGVDFVGIIGGDGTISLSLQAIVDTYPPDKLPRILLMRGGTMNVVAGNLGIFGKPANIMSDFLEFFHSGKAMTEIPLRTMEVNGKLGFLFGNGAAARFLTDFYKMKKTPASAAAFLGKLALGGTIGGKFSDAFRALTDVEPMAVRALPNNLPSASASIPQYSMLYAATVPKAPFGFTVCPGLEDFKADKAQLLAISAQGRTLLRHAAKVASGMIPSGEGIEHLLFERLDIKVRPGTQYTVDGELFHTDDGNIKIELGPEFIFCTPYGNVAGSKS